MDGGVSPFNNPSFQAFLYVTLSGYHVQWGTGAEQLLLVSAGTGASDPSRTPANIAAEGAVKALLSLMDDCAALVETLMQWMSASPTAREIDREMGDLGSDLVAGTSLLSYLRYNVMLSQKEVEELCPGLSTKEIASLGEMDNPDNLDVLLDLGEAAAERKVRDGDFPSTFDLQI